MSWEDRSGSRTSRNVLVATAIGLLALGWSSVGLTETTMSLYGGQAWTADSNVSLQRDDDTRLRYHDVSWNTEPFKMPPYWGARLTHWPNRPSDWGLALDFVHAKMISDRAAEVRLTGTRNGIPVDAVELLGDSFDRLEFSDGHNLLTANVLRRWRTDSIDGDRVGYRTSWHLGAGIGVAAPHAEVETAGLKTAEYQLAGVAAQLIAGTSIPISARWNVFAEYKWSWAELNTDLAAGGRLRTEALTHHLNIGVAFGGW